MVKSTKIEPLDRQLAVILAAITVGLYVRATPLDLLPGDAGEFQFAAWTFGLAHATGYPLYLLLGGAWQHLWAWFGASPAASLNVLSAVFAGSAVATFYLLLVRWFPATITPPVRRLAAGLGVAFLAANPTVRSQGLQAEVYTLHLLLLIMILWAAQRVVEVASPQAPTFARRFALLAVAVGVGLTHHATTLLIIPALLAYLTLGQRGWWRSSRAWQWAIPAGLLPLLLYLYVPLRSGPEASPWYHQRLGAATLTLYDNSAAAFLDFVTGRSISVGFHDMSTALAGTPTVAVLWLRHFEWPGLVLVFVGLYVLIRLRNWPVLALTLTYFVLQQTFNLFYAIGDIFVYYIPLYLVACIWIAFAGTGIGSGFQRSVTPASPADGVAAPARRQHWGPPLLALLLVLPLQMWIAYTPIFAQLKQDSATTRQRWEQILASAPPRNAILISNDRNEIVPLFYLQAVERRGLGYTGIFPLMTPEARFADVGATIQTALDAGAPVYLIKPMPGIESRFTLAPRTPPLIEVTGAAGAAPPQVRTDAAYGPLVLLGYDWTPTTAGADVVLHWQVTAPLPAKYTVTVQIFDAAGEKLGQDDRPPGGETYPTSLWKRGETLISPHPIALPTGAAPARMLVGLYTGADAQLIAPPLELTLHEPPETPR